MSDYLNPTLEGFALPAGRVDAAWRLVSPVAELRTTGQVCVLDGARMSGADARNQIVPTGSTFPGPRAWSPPT